MSEDLTIWSPTMCWPFSFNPFIISLIVILGYCLQHSSTVTHLYILHLTHYLRFTMLKLHRPEAQNLPHVLCTVVVSMPNTISRSQRWRQQLSSHNRPPVNPLHCYSLQSSLWWGCHHVVSKKNSTSKTEWCINIKLLFSISKKKQQQHPTFVNWN